jgi:F0F1-type ATP synthase assembly protein I
MQWAYRITGIGLTIALPGLGGYWLDGRLGTGFVFTIVGLFLGMAAGMVSLLRVAAEDSGRKRPPSNRRDRDSA